MAIQEEYEDALNWRAWAIGTMIKKRMRVRRVVWGRLLARAERRDGEVIRPAAVMVRSYSGKLR